MASIDIQGVSKRYKEATALSSADLRVASDREWPWSGPWCVGPGRSTSSIVGDVSRDPSRNDRIRRKDMFMRVTVIDIRYCFDLTGQRDRAWDFDFPVYPGLGLTISKPNLLSLVKEYCNFAVF